METKRGDDTPVQASAPSEDDQGSACRNCSQQRSPVGSIPHECQSYPVYPQHQHNGQYPPQIFTIPYSTMNHRSDMCYTPSPPPPYYLPLDMQHSGPMSHAFPPPYFFPGAAAQGFSSLDHNSRPPPYIHQSEPSSPRVTNQEQLRISVRPLAGLATIDCHSRLKFLRKVYLFHLLQLVVLNGFLCLFIYSTLIRDFFLNDYVCTIVAVASEFVIVFLLVSFKIFRKNYNFYIPLFLCSVALSFLVGLSAVNTTGREILLATTMNIIATCVLLIFAGKRMAFRTWGGIVIAVVPVLAGCTAYNFAYPHRINHSLIAGGGAMIMSLYVNWDMLKMLRGTHRCFPPKDESLFLCTLLLQKLLFCICFVICVFFIFM